MENRSEFVGNPINVALANQMATKYVVEKLIDQQLLNVENERS